MDDSDFGEVIRLLNKELKQTRARLRATEKERDELRSELESGMQMQMRAVKLEVVDDSGSNELSACLGGMCPAIDVIKRLKQELEDVRQAFTEQLEESRHALAKMTEEANQAAPVRHDVENLRALLKASEETLLKSEESRQRSRKSKEKWKAKYNELRDSLSSLIGGSTVTVLRSNPSGHEGDLASAKIVSDNESLVVPATDLLSTDAERNVSQRTSEQRSVRDIIDGLPEPDFPREYESCVAGIRKGAVTPDVKDSRFHASEADGYFNFPEGTAFRGSHAVVVFMDVHYSPETRGTEPRWIAYEELAHFKGQTRELFYRWKSQSYYAGTYEVLDRRNLTPDELEDFAYDGSLLHQVAKTALPAGMRGDKALRQLVLDALRDGIAHLECVVLRCIGFNSTLVRALRSEKDDPASRKRKPGGRNGHEDQPHFKKRKTADATD